MRRALLVLLIILVVAGGMTAVFLRSPSMQDRLIARMVRTRMDGPGPALLQDDALRALVCGSASPLPNLDRAGPCVAVMAAGRFYLVDIGPGSWENMATWRVPGDKVGAVLLTHFHSDHIGDLGEVNLQTWVAGRTAPLAVHGPQGVERVVGGFNEAYALDVGYREAHHGSTFMPAARGKLEAHPFKIAAGARVTVLEENGLRITAFGVEHKPIDPAVGYRFDYRGRSIVVSGDTIPSANLVENARGADVLLHEAQAHFMVDMMREAAIERGDRVAKVLADIPDYHTSPVQAAQIANDAGVGKLVLYHLTPAPPAGVAETIFMRGVSDVRSGVELSRDGLVVELPFDSKEISTWYLD